MKRRNKHYSKLVVYTEPRENLNLGVAHQNVEGMFKFTVHDASDGLPVVSYNVSLPKGVVSATQLFTSYEKDYIINRHEKRKV